MLKLSQYIVAEPIISDTPGGPTTVLCYSTRSAKMLALDVCLYQRLEKGDLTDIPAHLIQSLTADLILVNSDEDELKVVLDENQNFIDSSPVFKLVVQPTAACPLGCHYCGQRHGPKKLSLDEQAKVIDFTRRQVGANRSQIKTLYVVWFGAEPLSGLPALLKLSKQLQALAAEFNLSYSSAMVTNGLLLAPPVFENLVVSHKVTHFDITLDGDLEYHDQRRHLKTGGGTFSKIFSNLQSIALRQDLRFAVSIRCNTDERNRGGVSLLLQRLAGAGLNKRFHFYVAPLHSWGNDAHTLAADKEAFASWEVDWFIEMKRLDFHVELLPKRKEQVCMAVSRNAYLIDPFGDVFGCSEVSLVDTYLDPESKVNVHKIGSIRDEGAAAIKPRGIIGAMNQSIADKRFPCHSCPMLPACGGHCPKEWEEGVVPCPSFKFNMKDRLVLEYLIQKKAI